MNSAVAGKSSFFFFFFSLIISLIFKFLIDLLIFNAFFDVEFSTFVVYFDYLNSKRLCDFFFVSL